MPILPKTVTHDSRSKFNSQSGGSGADISLGLNFDSKKYWLDGSVKYRHVAKSKQQRSPLMKQDSNTSFGYGVAWKFYIKEGM